jgi:hypothetical protein
MTSNQLSAQSPVVSLHAAAIVAGLGLLVMAILAAFANFYVLPTIVVSGDASATAGNMVASARLLLIWLLWKGIRGFGTNP